MRRRLRGKQWPACIAAYARAGIAAGGARDWPGPIVRCRPASSRVCQGVAAALHDLAARGGGADEGFARARGSNTAGSLAAGARAGFKPRRPACVRFGCALRVRIDAGAGRVRAGKGAGSAACVAASLPQAGGRECSMACRRKGGAVCPRPAHLWRVASRLDAWPASRPAALGPGRRRYRRVGPAAPDLAAPDGPHRASARRRLRVAGGGFGDGGGLRHCPRLPAQALMPARGRAMVG